MPPALIRTLATLLTVLLLAGCSDDEEPEATPTDPQPSSTAANPTEEAEPEPEPGEVTLASLGIEDWPSDVDLLADAPRPRGLAPAVHQRLLRAMAGFADLAIDDRRIWSGRAALDILAAEVSEPFRSVLPVAYEQASSDRIAVVNYFGREVEVLDGPLVQHVWDVRPVEGGSRVYLQTWSAYEVREGDGPTRVVGVYREWQRTESAQGYTGWGWRESGADLCVQSDEDRFSPATGRAEDRELAWFVRTGGQHRFAIRSLPGNVDGGAERGCRKG